MNIKLIVTAISLIAFLAYTSCKNTDQSSHDEHSGHTNSEESHDEHETPGHNDDNSNEAHNHDSHNNEREISLTPEVMKMAEITISKVEKGKISRTLDLSGEVGFNEDCLVHITPRFPGIIKEARFKIGELVKAGETVAVIESNESMTTYSLKAPISGRIIEKHATAGEHMTEEESLYLIADLSTVWVNLAVYPKDADMVKQGQKATIFASGSETSTGGTISYITPVMDAQTRKITARIVLSNSSNTWRPGSFVNAIIETGEGNAGIVIDRDAVQILDGKSVVFIQHEPGSFKPVPITAGEKNSSRIMILSGLEEGQEYVNKGAFELKAKIVTSSLGAHAGHNH